MPITKRPDKSRIDNPAARAFVAAATAAETEEGKTKPVMIRFNRQLLERIDQAASEDGLNRSGWIQYVLTQALKQRDGR